MNMQIKTNIESLAYHIGSYMGMADGIEQRQYVDDLMVGAHRKTVPDFVKAAGMAAVRYNFTHMYEYGVAGLTRGDTQTLDRNHQNARLWRDVMVGNGSRKFITFIYRNATQRVPKPTEEETGVAQDVLNKLKISQGKRYTFSHKAEIFEQGVDLNIHPKTSKGVLFIPLKEAPFLKASPKETQRKYVFRKKLRINRGEESGATGRFSTFFFKWWGTEGNVLLTKRMDRHVTADIRRMEAELARVSGALQSPRNTNIKSASTAGQTKYRKQFTIWAQRDDGTKEVIV